MEMLILQIILAGVEQIPHLLAAIENSNQYTAEQKADLRARVVAAKARVAAVKFRDV